FTVTDAAGSETFELTMLEDQAVVVQDRYWVRCLPADFPGITVKTNPAVGAPTPGWYLVGNGKVAATSGGYAMVLDVHGTPVWYERAGVVLGVDSFAKNTLSFMPNATSPFGTSTAAAYEVHDLVAGTVTKLTAVGQATDGHELRMLPNGNHLVLAYPLTTGVDLTGLSIFGANSTMADCEIQEVDPSNALVWSWRASDHVDPMTESKEPTSYAVGAQTVVDVFHCNAIDVDSGGNLLLSMRHTNSVFYIDRSTGKILWKLGGTATNKDGATPIVVQNDPEGTFSMQHDARFLANGHVSLFDDHGAGFLGEVARGVEYSIDHTTDTATVAWQFLGSATSTFMGSTRRGDDGDTVIGWGGLTVGTTMLTEVNSTGAAVLDMSFGSGDASYRAVKVPLTQLDHDVLRRAAAQ
ncbi:MAG TPA: aryl-sulfate sulfotransferase, partial [Polyangiaceae bacterium]